MASSSTFLASALLNISCEICFMFLKIIIINKLVTCNKVLVNAFSVTNATYKKLILQIKISRVICWLRRAKKTKNKVKETIKMICLNF